MPDLKTISQSWTDRPDVRRWLAMAIASLLVCGVSSIGQVNSRKDDLTLGAGSPTTTTTVAAPGAGTDPTATTVAAGPATTVPAGGPAVAGASTGPQKTNAPPTRTGFTSVTDTPPPPPDTDYGLRTQGVTPTEVTLGISYNTSGCGDSGVLTAMVGAGTVGDIDSAIDAFTRHINDNGGIGGRTLKIAIADDGGGGCPEKALSAARKLVDDEKVFAVIPGLHDVSDYVAAQKVPTFIGRDDPASLERIGANGIGLTQEIEGNLIAWSAFGKYYLDTPNHVPCLVHPESGVSGDWDLYEDILLAKFSALGMSFRDIVVYKDDVSTAQTQSAAAAARLKDKGCDQVWFMAINPIAPIFFTQAATQARWFPQWTFTSYMALADTELGGRLQDQTQWDNAIGLSTRVPPGEHPKEGNCKRIYEQYYPNDGNGDSAAVILICTYWLTAAEMMRRGEAITGRLDANALVVGADAIDFDYSYDAHVPLNWAFPVGGPYKPKGWSHYTVVDWVSAQSKYVFPEYPLYWEVMGPGKSNGVDLRPLFQAS